MLKQRILTAIVLIPLALGAIFLLPLPWFGLVVLLVMALAAWEWAPLMGVCHRAGKLAYTLLCMALIGIFFWFIPLEQIWQSPSLHPIVYWLTVVGAVWWLIAIVLVLNFPRSKAVWQRSRIFVGLIGLLMLVPAWAAIIALRSEHYAQEPLHGAFLVLFVFLLVWAADVGAYFSGKKFGKHKLMPRVSPGKTLEGLVGGLALAILVMFVVAEYTNLFIEHSVGYYAVGIVTVLVSVFGDLNESMFKRCVGVKDSGSLLPGHGGILDRIDSLTSALPVFLFGYVWFMI
ncbi:phosphatidate cytidylyltransferase [Aliidiomarina haloalkalitolerans]|uniref:Phosphatidate cytidylyltransferase n=1 Tax=Aliidiomarina haloalkalitolerans TaxID=859059 RepID=A0A432VY73_9GAMM|nr:phosphatidate cytidylyltransferase [Aliidiomarina haloalkalitolerans]RUO21525.1 CDP-diglyceride synthetase [Aliidiomarina haloalkalitolerans]